MLFQDHIQTLFTGFADWSHKTDFESLGIHLTTFKTVLNFLEHHIWCLSEPSDQHELFEDHCFVKVAVLVLFDEHLGVCCILPRDASCSKDHTCDDSLEEWQVKHSILIIISSVSQHKPDSDEGSDEP